MSFFFKKSNTLNDTNPVTKSNPSNGDQLNINIKNHHTSKVKEEKEIVMVIDNLSNYQKNNFPIFTPSNSLSNTQSSPSAQMPNTITYDNINHQSLAMTNHTKNKMITSTGKATKSAMSDLQIQTQLFGKTDNCRTSMAMKNFDNSKRLEKMLGSINLTNEDIPQEVTIRHTMCCCFRKR